MSHHFTASSRLAAWAAAFATAIVLTACGGGGGGEGGEAPAPGTTPPVVGTVPPTVTPTVPPTVTPTVPPGPTFSFALAIDGPTRVVANQVALSYSAALTGGPTDGAVFDWAWGDGSANTAGNPAAKTWNSAGNAQVQLGATVNSQAVQATHSVVVVSEPVSAGDSHTCALKPDGTAVCWGANSNGELGIGVITTTQSTATVAVVDLTQAVALATGKQHTCALHGGGAVSCWGENSRGQLGNGTFVGTGSTGITRPAAVPGISDAVALAAGDFHTCALRATGQLLCWGINASGQLGDGTTNNTATPTAVLGLGNIVAVGASTNNTCALTAQGTMFCWGSNNKGQLGNGTTASATEAHPQPIAVQGLSDEPLAAITVGNEHHCALMQSGTARCWGNNNFGQLGDSTTTNSALPVVVPGLTGITMLSAGSRHTCALSASNAQVSCWGINSTGQLGIGTTAPTTGINTVIDLTDAITINAGLFHTCALRSNGAISCWGQGGSNQLGNGSTALKSRPVPVAGDNIFWH
jgi:alpha-tubulin suppressor-like RCC1 family protein